MLKAIEQRMSAVVIGGIIAILVVLGIVFVSGQMDESDIEGPGQRDQFTTDSR